MWLLSQLTIIGVILLICSALQAIISFSAWDRSHNSTARLFFLEIITRLFGSSFNSLHRFILALCKFHYCNLSEHFRNIWLMCFWGWFLPILQFLCLTYGVFGLILSLLQFFGYFWPKNCSDERNSLHICIRQVFA